MVRKAFPILMFCCLLASCSSKADVDIQPLGTRYNNINNYSIETPQGVMSIQNQQVVLDQALIEVGQLKPSATAPTLSMIDDCIYVNGENGLERYNFTTKLWDPMYYDLMEFSFASLTSVYYINNYDLYRSQGPEDTLLVDAQVVKDVYLLHGNCFYYISGENLKELDLTTDVTKEITKLSSPVTSLSATDAELTIATIDGNITLPLKSGKVAVS